MQEQIKSQNRKYFFDDVESKLVYGHKRQTKPLVSIVMPIYNQIDFLKSAIQSCLNQDSSIDYDIVIVDNNHPEFQKVNEEIVKSFNSDKILYYVNLQNIGACGNWNRCIDLADGEYLTYCHNDDMLAEGSLKALTSEIDPRNPHRLIVGYYNVIDKDGRVTSTPRNGLYRRLKHNYSNFLLVINNPSNGCGTLYHRESMLAIGGFNDDYTPCPDYAINATYIDKFGGIKIPQTTFLYRISGANDSATCYTAVPEANKIIMSEIVQRIKFFKGLARYAAGISLKSTIVANQRKWENKNTSVSLFEHFIFSLYLRIITILNIRL